MINPDADLAEYLAARDRHEMKRNVIRYDGQMLINLGGIVLVTPETAADLTVVDDRDRGHELVLACRARPDHR